ncbi:MAG: glycosyltransferase family 1 protein [Candidatus Neomarinimicrobiota bacterium]|nr:MAG: glycosyltransferase family 1 protein [Candidatus Neomarinimicrobiota bacterium]RKY54698.1 MAG: glycosyltransferase family 1 protein [Candidatus Neomarinimicrobiota bacterium]
MNSGNLLKNSGVCKICHLSTVHSAGDTRIFHKECMSLAKAGYSVYFVVTAEGNKEVNGVRIVPLPRVKNRILRISMKSGLALYKSFKVGACIYHFHDPELIPVGLILKLLGKKVIYDVHEDVPEQILSKDYLPSFLKGLLSRIFRNFEKLSVKAFDFVITATEAIKNKFVGRTDSVEAVKNYISLEYVREGFVNKSKKEVLDLIFIGVIYRERGIIEGLKALCLFPDLPVKFVLYGPVSDSFLSELRSIDSVGKLEYRGIIPYPEVIDKLLEADIGYLCDLPLKRHMEGLPVKLFEYMAAGLPVIASDFPIWRRIVEGYSCGVCVNPVDCRSIAMAIEYLCENPDLRKQMGLNGKKAIVEEFNWERESDKLVNIYRKLCGGKNV